MTQVPVEPRESHVSTAESPVPTRESRVSTTESSVRPRESSVSARESRSAHTGDAAGVDPADIAAVTAQLGRAPRGMREVAHRCPCGQPTVVRTSPRLPDGTPFPTTYYLTCTRLNARLGGIEADGRMREMTARLATDPELATAYRRAHEAYLAERDAMEPLGTDVTAGGMPGRVKCLHALVAHALAAGPGVNPFGDEALAEVGDWWKPNPCPPPPV